MGSTVRPLILLPADLTGSKTGGIQSFVRDFIKFAPDDFAIEVVGATADRRTLPMGRWIEVAIEGRHVRYLGITAAPLENRRNRIPMALRFTMALLAHRRAFTTVGRVLNFHRAGVPLATLRDPAPKVQFVHLNVADIYGKAGESRWRMLPGAYHRIEDLTLERMDRIYVVNEAGVDFYRRRHPTVTDRVQFLSTWYDDTRFVAVGAEERSRRRAELRHELELPPEGRNVLFVGRLEAQKDPVLVVEGFAQALRADAGLALVVVGSGGLAEAARRAAERLGIEAAVRFVGARPRSEIASYMTASDVLLLPSRFEGMPITVLEALGSGLPVAATPVGEVPRLVRPGETGWLAPDRAPESVAEAIREALAIPAAAVEAACASVAGQYRAAAVLEPVYAFQRSLAGRSSAGAEPQPHA